MAEDSETKKEISQKFVNSIKNWVTIDDKIKKLRDEIKELTTEKKQYEEVVISELDKMEEKVISITDGKLHKSVSKTQEPLKKETIQKSILSFIKDETKTKELMENMMNSRKVVEKVNLKRTKNREPKKDKK
jgi:hypothetical protein